jgi:hypothetical protein
MNWNPSCFKPFRLNGVSSAGKAASSIASEATVKMALQHANGGYPPKYEQFYLSKVMPSLQNHTNGLMMRLFGKIVPSL